MPPFPGFPEGKVRLTPVPASFFSQLMPEIDRLEELKLTLYIFWRLDRMEGDFRYLRHPDFAEDKSFMRGMGNSKESALLALDEALASAVDRGTLLKVSLQLASGEETFYFLNSPKGRAGARAMLAGDWHPSDDAQFPVELMAEPPNIFRLYEENIGPLTPMISEALKDAEKTYPNPWIKDAIRIAIENNARSWRYVTAILDRWQQEGRYEPKDRRDSEKDRRRYIEGEFSDFIEH